MIWDLGFGCFVPRRKRHSGEQNKAWLLAESGGSGAGEPHSVHSSFRFSLCTQVELESMAVNSSSSSSNTCSSATVLMVNLNNGMLTDSTKSREIKWSRLESLERSLSPVTHSLVRFSYSEILSATRNFSKGRYLLLVCFLLVIVAYLRILVLVLIINWCAVGELSR